MSSSIVLVCAVLASMAAGVLLAYGICLSMFAIFDSRVRRVATGSLPVVISPSQTVEGQVNAALQGRIKVNI